MSRIGKQPITIPSGVKVDVNGGKVAVSGPKGNLELDTRDDVVGVAGDISPEELGQRLDQAFGSLPEGQPPAAIGQAQGREFQLCADLGRQIALKKALCNLATLKRIAKKAVMGIICRH